MFWKTIKHSHHKYVFSIAVQTNAVLGSKLLHCIQNLRRYNKNVLNMYMHSKQSSCVKKSALKSMHAYEVSQIFPKQFLPNFYLISFFSLSFYSIFFLLLLFFPWAKYCLPCFLVVPNKLNFKQCFKIYFSEYWCISLTGFFFLFRL